MKFVMVPAESLRAGDVVAVDKTPTKYAQPLAEVNVRSEYVELVFLEKSHYSEQTIRAAGRFNHQDPVALVLGVDDHVEEAVRRWLNDTLDAF